MYIGLHVKYLLFLSECDETLIDFLKYSKTKFYENPSSGGPVVPCRKTDKTKLTVAFCNFAKMPENDF
jgi:hypothetical protein